MLQVIESYNLFEMNNKGLANHCFKKNKICRILPLADVSIRAWLRTEFLVWNSKPDQRMVEKVDIQSFYTDERLSLYRVSVGCKRCQHDLLSICDPLSFFPNMFDHVRLLKKYDTKVIDSWNIRSFHEFVIHAIDGGYYISTFWIPVFRRDMRALWVSSSNIYLWL